MKIPLKVYVYVFQGVCITVSVYIEMRPLYQTVTTRFYLPVLQGDGAFQYSAEVVAFDSHKEINSAFSRFYLLHQGIAENEETHQASHCPFFFSHFFSTKKADFKPANNSPCKVWENPPRNGLISCLAIRNWWKLVRILHRCFPCWWDYIMQDQEVIVFTHLYHTVSI